MLTVAFMIVVTFQVIIEKLAKDSVGKPLLISWYLLIPLGAMTLILQDPVYLQWKFSIIYWLFGSVLLGSQLIKGPFMLKTAFIAIAPQLDEVPLNAWKNVTYFISLAFITIGTINLYFIYFADINMWVNFKFLGVTFLILITVSSTLFYLFSKTTSSSET